MRRRDVLGTTAFGLVAVATSGARAETAPTDEFVFEVQRTDEEWRARLTDEVHFLLRRGGTEPKRSSAHWDARQDGSYHCKGCDLKLYDSYWQTYPDIGWVFFKHSEKFAVLTDIDRLTYGEVSSSGEDLSTMAANMQSAQELTEEEIRSLDNLAGMEAVCRRCGSHLGHLVSVRNTVLHCINGAGLEFKPRTA